MKEKYVKALGLSIIILLAMSYTLSAHAFLDEMMKKGKEQA